MRSRSIEQLVRKLRLEGRKYTAVCDSAPAVRPPQRYGRGIQKSHAYGDLHGMAYWQLLCNVCEQCGHGYQMRQPGAKEVRDFPIGVSRRCLRAECAECAGCFKSHNQ